MGMYQQIESADITADEKLALVCEILDGHQMQNATMREHGLGAFMVRIDYPGARASERSKEFDNMADAMTIFRHHTLRIEQENAPLGSTVELQFTNMNESATLARFEIG